MRRPTILIADDHAVVAEGLASLLRSEFTVVGTAPDGAALLAMARRLKPDIVVTDMAMPGVTGLDALRRQGVDARRILLVGGVAQNPAVSAESAVDYRPIIREQSTAR